MLQQIRALRGLALRTTARVQIAARRAAARLHREELGQTTWVSELMVLGIIVVIAAVIFAFWKAGGLTWVTTRLNSITTY